ncbi:MAG: ribose 5-phosphate isomerase B [Spirochaetes bacterium]|nr:ribose 5-phosphate isomerase B [Spirochaetota bacterium]
MDKSIKIFIASDHGGFELKGKIIKHLSDSGYNVEDMGCSSIDSVDYPLYGKKVSEKVADGEGVGILICGTGIGMSITANRYSDVRAALCMNGYMAKMSKMHNNANVLVLGARVLGEGLAFDIVDTWLSTEFEGGRHQKRLDMLE